MVVAADRCPGEDVFADFFDARLDDAAIKSLHSHLDVCATCRTLFAELSRLSPDADPSAPTVGSPARAKTQPALAAIGRFDVVRMLGEGGMGTVFLARDPDLDRQIAIKVLKAGGDEARLIEEARSQAQLSHPNVVRVYEVGHGAGGLYIAMELVEGETLRDWLSRKPPWEEVVAAFDAAGRGLAAAHAAGLVHRDFKPANVMVGNDGRIAVTDFGLARSERRPARRRRAPTEEGAVVGTPAYLAPEQCRGGIATAAADQFAFGVSLYEGLYGIRPFDGKDPETIIDNILRAQVRPPPESTVPPWLREIVMRALSPEPNDRFPSIEALLDAIDERLERQTQRRDCPFPGLAAFDVADSDVYFGRDAEIAEAARRVSDTGFLAVVGPSGSGKSSFVRAGLIPALRKQSRVVELLIRPGPRPRATLVRLLADIGKADMAPEQLGQALAEHAIAHKSRVILVVDQLEELFTLTHDADEQRLVIDALDAIAERYADRVRCVVTIRSDMLERVQAHKHFLRRIVSGLLFLTNPDRDSLRDALTRPLAQVDYTLESPEIADAIASELAGKPGALPLLQFTARRLWVQADHERKLVTTASYRALGELAGLLADHASSVIAALDAADRDLAREILIRLVTPDRTRAVVPIADLPSGAGHVIEALVAARLVVVTDANTAELVHESLIDRWPNLRKWLDELDQGAALFAEVSEAARRWSARARPPGLLWQGETARRLEHFQSHYRGTLTDDESAFVEAALDGDRRQRRRKRTALIGAFGALTAMVLGAVVAIVLIREAADAANRSATEAHASELKATRQQHAAEQEARRAQAAEHKLAEELVELQRAQTGRAVAEAKVTTTTKQLDMTYDELKRALAAAQRETARATAASKDAAAAAERERLLRTQTEKLLADKQAELDRAKQESAKINTKLKGVP